LLNQNFACEAPNTVWLADISVPQQAA